MKSIIVLLSLTLCLNSAMAQSPAMTELLNTYRSTSTTDANFVRGQELWQQNIEINGQSRSCSSCHSTDLTQQGKHQQTGKTIQAMAPSISPDRLTDSAKIEKWFKRNCKWTWGRECTSQEKADFLIYIDQYASRI